MKKTTSLSAIIVIMLIFGTGGFAFAQAALNLTGYFVAVNGQQTGPHDTAGLTELLNRGQLNRDTLVWQEGMATWVAAGTVEELAPLFPAYHALEAADGIQASRNWLSLEIESGLTGGSLRYVRDINRAFSISFAGRFNFWFENLLDSDDTQWVSHDTQWFLRFGALLAGRFYPMDFPVFFELGAGGELEFRDLGGDRGIDNRWRFMAVPAIGARLGGQGGGLFLSPFLSFPVAFFPDWNEVNAWTTITLRAGVGLGWAW